MKEAQKTYIFYEIGDSCKSEFHMADGEFHATDDAVVLGESEGETAAEAFENLKEESPWIKEYRTDEIVARKIGEPIYL